jgi:HPt (histidine-containing phosphotransfer) domain-containing protein
MSEPRIDRAIFAELQAAAGADFVVELVDTFMQEAPVMLGELRAARAEGAPEQFRRAAHSLKSNANTFGATELARLARELELGELPQEVASLDALVAAFDAAAAELKALCHGR